MRSRRVSGIALRSQALLGLLRQVIGVKDLYRSQRGRLDGMMMWSSRIMIDLVGVELNFGLDCGTGGGKAARADQAVGLKSLGKLEHRT